jgi:hypothetical protein
VPTTFLTRFKRRPVAMIALWLVVLQSFLTGVATAQAGAALADPLASAIICHVGGGTDPSEPAGSDAGGTWHLCCSYCMAAAPALLPPSMQIGRAGEGGATAVPRLWSFRVTIDRGAVRAGPSQAPPDRA